MSYSQGFDVINLPVYIVCSVGAVANLMLLIAFVKDPLKCFRNSATYLVGNLALSDMVYNLHLITEVLQNVRNDVVDFFSYFSFYSSMVTIFSIALDRFLMIRYPFKHRILMSKNKMAAWIAVIWLLSSLHSFKKGFAPSDFDGIMKPCFGATSIILTGILYSKTCFALRKQSALMIGKKSAFSSPKSGNTSKEINSINQETGEVGFVDIEDNNERAKNLNVRAQLQSGPVRNLNKRVQIRDEGVKIHDQRAQNWSERAGDKQQRAQNQYKRDQNQDERAKSQHKRVCSEDERAQIRHERPQNKRERAQHQDQRAESQTKHADCAETQFDIQDNSTTTITHKCSTDHRLQNPRDKRHKNPQSVTNAKEQRFLNTIIIIALITVVTVMSGTTYGQIVPIVLKRNPNLNTILKPVLLLIYSLNFTVNPFVYYLRLKQYRKTFQMVYGCKF